MAEKKVVEGIHKSAWGHGEQAVTIEENGVRRELLWDNDTVVKPYLVDVLVDEKDLAPDEEDARGPLKEWCTEYITTYANLIEYPVIKGMTVGDLDSMIEGFLAGWNACKELQTVA